MTIAQAAPAQSPTNSLSYFLNSGLFWLVLAAVGAFAFYETGLDALIYTWSRLEYSHGYFIPPIAVYILLHQLRHQEVLPSAQLPRRGWGIATVCLGLLVGLLGNLVHMPDVNSYGLIVAVAGFVFIIFGIRQGLRHWAPIFYLTFMLPLPTVVYWSLSTKLQLISSVIGVKIVSFLGIPVYLDGNIIDLGNYTLLVAEACSGLRYLFPLMSFGFLFAVLYRGPAWHKLVIFISTIPITLLMNSVRIALTAVLVDRYGIEQAEGFIHFFEGWVIFIVCIAILYLEAVLLQRLTKNRQPIHRMLDFDFQFLARQMRGIFHIQPSPALILASVAMLIGGIVWQLTPARADLAPDRDLLVLFPQELAQWRGERRLLDPKTEQVLGASDYLDADYATAGGGEGVNLLLVYYKSLTAGGGAIHSPEVCLPGSGWEVSKWATIETGLTMPSGRPLMVNRAVIQKGLSRQVVYYWFEGRGRSLYSDYLAKGYTVIDSVMRGRSDGGLARVMTPIATNERVEDADARLRGFLALVIPQLAAYMPE